MSKNWEAFTEFCGSLQIESGKGRKSLRRKWSNLRQLASRVLPQIPDSELMALLGKKRTELDPEENDLKAITSYSVGKGLLKAPEVREALKADESESPLYFLAELSGKSFGESIAPKICQYWLCGELDGWAKQPASGYYDIAWTSVELRKPVRIEIKASSESPAFRFQQIRHPKIGHANTLDYDTLLCVGVTASSLEFWFIPAQAVIDFIESGLFTNQHGGKKIDSNTYWVMADDNARGKMGKYFAEPEKLRNFALSLTGQG
jgi:hypothetical protein